MGTVSPSDWLLDLLADVRGAEGVVQLGPLDALRVPLDLRVHHDDSAGGSLLICGWRECVGIESPDSLQLFINYKLKSVAHLPWRMLSYKFINTFIDDLFAFVIRMPTMYRIGCFRDDIVFLVRTLSGENGGEFMGTF
jgi:hypothetical protein